MEPGEWRMCPVWWKIDVKEAENKQMWQMWQILHNLVALTKARVECNQDNSESLLDSRLLVRKIFAYTFAVKVSNMSLMPTAL